MNKKQKLILLDILGVFFLFWGIVAISLSMYNQNPTQILYMCYLGLVLIGVGILTKRSFIIMSQVYILAIPLIVWDIDFLHWLILNKPLFGITNYFFAEGHSLLGKIISLQHLFTVPIAVYAASLIGIKRKDAWKWSFIQIILVYIFVSLFTPSDININCIFNPCINIHFGLPYRLTWFLIIFSLTFLSSLGINLIALRDKSRGDKGMI
ncbi:MAG: hypothetical protein ABIJ14_03900 [Nanoarchaeota archaeon]